MLEHDAGTSFLELALAPARPGGCTDDNGKISNGCFVTAYIVYMLMSGLITLKQQKAQQKMENEPPLPTIPMETVERMEAECTFWWQPPLWWDQQPFWMSRPPRWLNDVAVRDDLAGTSLLQLKEGHSFAPAERELPSAEPQSPLEEAQPTREDRPKAKGATAGVATTAAIAIAAAAAAPPRPAEGWSEAEAAEARQLQAELAQAHRQVSQQQQMLTLDHHLVWKLQGLLRRLGAGGEGVEAIDSGGATAGGGEPQRTAAGPRM